MVRRVIQLFYREIRGLHQAAYLLAIFAFGSQFLAIIRDRLLAHSFGAGVELDLYYTAFRIPDVLFVVFASILSVYVLIPFVTRAQQSGGDDAAARLLGSVFTFFIFCYSLLALLLILTAPYFVPYVFSSFTGTELETLINLIQILLLQPLFLGISTLLGVVTQMHKRFVIYAISPILYNVGIIFGVIFLYPWIGLNGLVWGVVLGALAHLAVQIPIVLRSSFRFSLVWPRLHTLTPIFRTAVPRAVTLSLNQLVLLVLTIIATTMTVGSVSVFQFAFNLQSVPLTIIGVSYSVAAFPVLAGFLAGQEYHKFRTHIQTAFRHVIFWSLPVIALIVVLRAHIVRLTLGTGNFGWEDTRLTAAILAIFVISLLAQSINLLTIRAFYANGDTRTPLFVATLGSVATLSFAYVGYQYLYYIPMVQNSLEQGLRLTEVAGTEVIMLAIGFSIGVSLQAIIMLWFLHRSFTQILKPLRMIVANSVLVACVGGGVVYGALQFLVEGIKQDTFVGILLQGGIAGVLGIIAMYATHYWLRSPELLEIHRAITRRLRGKANLGRPQHDTL